MTMIIKSMNKYAKYITLFLSLLVIGCGKTENKNVTGSKLIDTIDETISFVNEWEEKSTTTSPQTVNMNLENDTPASDISSVDPDTISNEEVAIQTIDQTYDLNVLTTILIKYPQEKYPTIIKRVRLRIHNIFKQEEELINSHCINECPYSVMMKILKRRPKSVNFLNEYNFKKICITEPIVVQNHLKKHITNTNLLDLVEDQTLGQSIICSTMNEAQVKQRISSFLSDLRDKDQLMSMDEFKQHIKSFNIEYEEYKSLFPFYYYKGVSIDRILGSRFIEKTANDLNLKSIKVPKKIAVIKDGKEDLFKINFDKYLVFSSNDIDVYAESIEPLKRKATRAEVRDFFEIVQATGFSDYFGENYILGKNSTGEEGIYFIDTEKLNFSYFPIENSNNQFTRRITQIIDKKDYSWANILLSEYIYNDQNIGRRYIINNNLANQASFGNLIKTFPNQEITPLLREKKTSTISLPQIEIEFSSEEESEEEEEEDFGIEEYSFSIKKLKD
jgi:hypothetical protein